MARRRHHGSGYTTGTGQGIRRPYAYVDRYDPWAEAASDIAKAITAISQESATQRQQDRVFNRQIMTSLANIDADMEASQIEDRMATLNKMIEKESDPMLQDYATALVGEMGGVRDIVVHREEYSNRFNKTQDALDSLQQQIISKGDYSGGSEAQELFETLGQSYSDNISKFDAAQRAYYRQALKQMDEQSSVLTALELLDTDKELRGVQLDPNKYTASSQALVDQAEHLVAAGQYGDARRTMYQMGGVESRAAKQTENIYRTGVIESRRLVRDVYAGAGDDNELKEILSNVNQLSKGGTLPLNISPDVIAKQKGETAEAMMKFVRHQYPVNYPEQIDTIDADGNKVTHQFGDIMRGWDDGLISSEDAISQIMGAFNVSIVDGRVVMPGKKGQGRTRADRDASGSEWVREVKEDQYLTKSLQDLYEFYISLGNYETSLREPVNRRGPQAVDQEVTDALGGVGSWTSK
tara:strand:- start:332 stop:1732 length:1401 start_codon:yes stop_codon:yes gene_type:complete